MRASSAKTGKPAYLAGSVPAILLLWLGCASAESGAYRVELLVFRYADSTQEPIEVDEISNFPRAWRLHEPRAVHLPEDPAPLGAMSDRMRAAWNRLERRDGYEPLLFVNWEQSRIDYHPPVRIHDQELMLERLVLPEDAAYVDLRSGDLFATYRQFFYRLDGTVQLRRTRFLHLDLNLEYRVERWERPTEGDAVPQNPAEQPPAPLVFTSRDIEPSLVELIPEPFWNPPAPLLEPVIDPPPPVPGARVHRLRESRQIHSNDLLYFDTPYLGVLARVTATAGE